MKRAKSLNWYRHTYCGYTDFIIISRRQMRMRKTTICSIHLAYEMNRVTSLLYNAPIFSHQITLQICWNWDEVYLPLGFSGKFSNSEKYYCSSLEKIECFCSFAATSTRIVYKNVIQECNRRRCRHSSESLATLNIWRKYIKVNWIYISDHSKTINKWCPVVS